MKAFELTEQKLEECGFTQGSPTSDDCCWYWWRPGVARDIDRRGTTATIAVVWNMCPDLGPVGFRVDGYPLPRSLWPRTAEQLDTLMTLIEENNE